jgi:hypothetical protein
MPKVNCFLCGKEVPGRKLGPRKCIVCHNKNRPKGKDSVRWTGKIECKLCGGIKSNCKAEICRKCWKKNPPSGERHYNYGKQLSDETKMKISTMLIGKRMGADNHRFNPNKQVRRTYRFPYRKWRKEVLERDQNTCQKCGCENSNIVHHINPYKDRPDNLDPLNGITLCDKCHRITFGIEYKFVEEFEEIVKKRVNSGEVQNG